MAKFYLVGDIQNNDLWLVNTEQRTVTRVMVDEDAAIFGTALEPFGNFGGTVDLGSSSVELTARELARAIFQAAARGMTVVNVPVCIASEMPTGRVESAQRDAIGEARVAQRDVG